ncbi:MAG: hypothetical protein K2K57_05030 [Oscillospiraceae bacterium]|nr:hypothetical protein [Oscillospiraceae bacterium]
MSKKLRKAAIALAAVITVSANGITAGAFDSPWAKPTEKNTAAADSVQTSTASEESGIHLSRKSVEMTKGEKVSIKLTGAEGTVKWTVSDKNIFTYSGGIITAKGAGKGTLTAEYKGKKYKCTVTVSEKIDDFGADIYSLKLKKGGTGTVKINTAGKQVMVMSDNANVCSLKCSALIDGCFDLTVTAKANGSCNIVVYDVNNTKDKFTVKLTVSEQTGTDKSRPDTAKTIGAQMGAKAQQKTETDADDTSDYIDEVIRLCNEERESAGLAPLKKSDSLTDSAAVRVGEIPNKFSHTRPDGSSCFTAITEKSKTSGENIAAGHEDPEQVVDGWMNSPGHRANILNPDFTEIGVGYNENGNYWVQLFIG